MSDANNTPGGSEDLAQIRREIEQTRQDLGRTIDAIQGKASPDRIKGKVTEEVQKATRDKAASALHKLGALAGKGAGVARALATKSKPAPPALKSDDGTPLPHRRASAPSTVGGGALKPVAEQVVVVFGASSGIGRETALEFGKRGAKVVVSGRNKEGLDTLVEDIKYTNPNVIAVEADATSSVSLKALADKAVEEFGRLDTWVHVAGVSVYATVEETTPQEYQRVLDVNAVGVHRAIQAAAPHLKNEQGGAFIAVSSVEGMRAFPYQMAYSSSKHAVVAILEAWRVEMQKEGWPISVTNVMPSGINTPLFNKARTKIGVKPQPVSPVYQPSVVAEVILYAAEHPTRDIVAGGAGQAMILGQRISPALMDRFVLVGGFDGQKTSEERSADFASNLYDTLSEARLFHVGGDFSITAKAKSLGNWLETHPAARRAIYAGIAMFLFLRLRRGRD